MRYHLTKIWPQKYRKLSRKYLLIFYRILKNGVTIFYHLNNSDMLSWLLNLVNTFFIKILIVIGIVDHTEAKRRHTGGKILGFFYWLNECLLFV